MSGSDLADLLRTLVGESTSRQCRHVSLRYVMSKRGPLSQYEVPEAVLAILEIGRR